jgi:hypothetical protein
MDSLCSAYTLHTHARFGSSVQQTFVILIIVSALVNNHSHCNVNCNDLIQVLFTVYSKNTKASADIKTPPMRPSFTRDLFRDVVIAPCVLPYHFEQRPQDAGSMRMNVPPRGSPRPVAAANALALKYKRDMDELTMV